jgi:Zn-dependent protease
MSEVSSEMHSTSIGQTEFEQITTLVSAEFQIEETMLDHGVPTYYLKQPQETKYAFLKLLKKLEAMNLVAILRRMEGRTVLRVIPKPPTKPSNPILNYVLFLATFATTFLTGYMLSLRVVDPLTGGIAFTISILAVLGMHEMGHKITASAKGIEATLPYFIPGPPPYGTFGAVIMQKSLPPNKDALFDVGARGPISGFIVAVVVSAIGLSFSVPSPQIEDTTPLPSPLVWILIARFLLSLKIMPIPPPNGILLVHPVAFAGWVGIVVTMLNLLPAAMLDGGHVARSMVNEKMGFILSTLSILFLIIEGFWPMALLVLFMSMYRHPGPLDDVSSLSMSRKLLTIALIAIFILCSFPPFEF